MSPIEVVQIKMEQEDDIEATSLVQDMRYEMYVRNYNNCINFQMILTAQ